MDRLLKLIKDQRVLIISLFLFGTLYSILSLINHYNFRTFAMDLGIYTNALYDYINFQWNDSTVFKEIPQNLLADHFDLYLIIFSPFSLIFGTYTLLIIQIFFLLFGSIGVYMFFNAKKYANNIANYAVLYYLLFYGIYSALSFDYHSNVVAASIIPWFFYFVDRRKFWQSFLVLVAIIISKENTSFWVFFICAGLLFDYKHDKQTRNFLMAAGVFSLIYFITIINFVMPALSPSGTYPHFNYSVLGEGPVDALIFLITHPIESLKLLFVNHTNHINGDYVKLELHIFLLSSGLFLLFRKPQYILMLIPIFAQKLFHDKITMWSISGQYSIEFLPILTIGIFKIIAEIKNSKLATILSVVVVLLAGSTTMRLMDNTTFYTDKTRYRFYQEAHYKRNYNVKSVHLNLSSIPEDAVVSVQSPFLPHLSLRDNIYTFPIIKDSEYIVISFNEVPYPMDENDFMAKYKELVESEEWVEILNDEIIIFHKKR